MINKKSTENVCMVTPSSNSNSRSFQIEYLTSSDVSPVTHAPLHLCTEGASCIVNPTLLHRSDCIKELTSEAGGVKSENQPLTTLGSEYIPSMSCISDVHDEIMPLREGEERVQSELERSCKGGVCVSKKNESFPYSLDVAFLTICKEQRLIKSLDFLITPSVLDSQIVLGSASDQPLKYVIAPKVDNFELKDPHNAHACTIHSARYTMPLLLYSCTFAPQVHCARSEFDSKGERSGIG